MEADKRYILVADDEIQTLNTLEFLLEGAGYDVTLANSGDQAWSLIQESLGAEGRILDMIITDIQMPGLTGLELMEKLESARVDIPVLVISGYGDKPMVVKLMRHGCSDFLDKPFEPEDLLTRVQNILDKRRASQAEKEHILRQDAAERLEFERILDTYRCNLDQMRLQIQSARGAYENLIGIRETGYRVRVSYRNRPLEEMGGDLFDIRDTPTGCDIIVADVSGHDMGASYNSVLIKAFFDENVRTGRDGETFFRLLNHQLRENNREERMVTALFVRINLDKMWAEVVAAGHPHLIKLNPRLPIPSTARVNGDVLGVLENVSFGRKVISLEPGFRFFFHTDGVTSAPTVDGPSGRRTPLRDAGLDDLLEMHARLPLEEIIQRTWDDILLYCHFKPNDDMLLAGIEIPSPDSVGNRG